MLPYISLLVKPASGSCNMKCDYCFYCDEASKRESPSYGMMSDTTLKNVIRKSILSASEGCTIGFQGGEPTLCGLDFYKKVITYCKQYNKRNIPIQFTLQTNGYAITKKWCEFFKEYNFLIGLSVDGIEETHNIYRHNPQGNPTYDRVIETAQLFDQYQVEYNILTVVHKEIAIRIKEVYEDYRKRGWNYMQYIACLDPIGEIKGQKEYSLTPELYGQFLCDLFGAWYQDFLKGKQPFIRQFENYIGLLAGYMPESCEQRGICGIQHVIEADGSVYPCDFYALDAYRLGNLNVDSIQTIEEARQQLGFIQKSANHSMECRSCRWFKLCRGGCYRSREGEINNYYCKGYKIFFQQCYHAMHEIARGITK